MIISRTPFRISFAGGGSDLQDFYMKHQGAVLSATIDKYIYLSIHEFFDGQQILLKYSKNELVDSVEQIKHPIIREVFSDHKIQGVDFNSSADIPSGTGLASSSAFTAGLINLCNAYTGKFMSKEAIAKYACDIEINRLKEPIGKQDQYACAIGGMNFIEFNKDESVSVEKIVLTKEKNIELNNSLLMFYLGTTRAAGSILVEQKKNMNSDSARIEMLKKMVDLAYKLREDLKNNTIDNFGKILHEGWLLKKELASSISNSGIDGYYEIAMKNGAEGGKLLGAGGGGFLLFFVKPENQKKLREALSDLKEVPFNFDNTGTTIIY
jgi:D-glycero-alpha-D-manno-heptose-7-phosphate kinase